MSPDIELMEKIDTAYRASTGLEDRRHYSIFYSQILPSDILIIGFNPGGDPGASDESKLASTSFYENGEHEYVDCDYALAMAMRGFLINTGVAASVEDIRSIPKINLIFRRSSIMNQLPLSAREALAESKPFVEQILQAVKPRVIVFEGLSTMEKFESLYCSNGFPEMYTGEVYTPNGRAKARIYRAGTGTVDCLNKECVLVGIGHPSKYGRRAEWSQVEEKARSLFDAMETGQLGRMINLHQPGLDIDPMIDDRSIGGSKMTKLSRSEHADHVIRVIDKEAQPYLMGSQRDKAWRVISLMDGLTIEKAHEILEALEPGIQGKVGRPLGWVQDAIDRDIISIEVPVTSP